MLIKAQQLDNLDVIDMRSGQPVAKLGRPIIDPFKLEVVGFHTTHQTESLLLMRNIRELNRKQAIIDDEEDFSVAEDLPRLKEVLDIDYNLTGKKVYTQSKKRLGKVEDYIIETLGFQIQKIHVHQSVWHSFTGSTLIVDRKQIIEVNDDAITVSDATVQSGALAAQQTT